MFLITGISLGFWLSWPGIIIPNNWRCFKDIILRTKDEKVSFKAILAVSPNYFLKGRKNNIGSKLRIVSDACFR